MGTALSTSTDFSANEYIVRFIGKDYISPNDPFWNRFLAFNIPPPITSEAQLALNTKVDPVCQTLLSNNIESGNLNSLIQVFLMRASELSAATNTDDNIFGWQTFNALFSIRCILKYLIETLTEEQLIQHIECSKENSANLENLIGALVGIIVDVPLKDFTYPVHLEAVTSLLILLSVHIHNNNRADQSVVYRLIMKGRHSIHAPLFMKNLLQNFIDQRKAPPGFTNNQGHSIVLGIASELWSILTFNKKGSDTIETTDNVEEIPLATQSLLLILVLTNHCTTQNNPYRQSLFSCANSQDNNPIPPTKTPSLFKLNYETLYSSLCKWASGDSATLLLYLLLHRNPFFKCHLLNRVDLDLLVIPILKTLYHAPNSNSHHIYMSLIILLILSEDESFNRNIHQTKVKTVTWYTERTLSDLSLGGLLVLVVIRTIQYNMLKIRDKYLHTNCLAALANMSAQFRDLHPYVSQRLVSLFETLAKRYQKLYVQLHNNKHNKNSEVSVALVQENVDNEQDLAVLEEVLRMVLEIFNSCLSSQLTNNPNLLYTLLYKRQVFEPFKNNVAFQDIVQNIEIVIEYFSDLLKTKSHQHEVDAHQVLSVIQQGAKHWPKEKLTKFPDLKFKYVEEEQPEEFFIPYVWALVNQHSTLHWGSEVSSLNSTVC